MAELLGIRVGLAAPDENVLRGIVADGPIAWLGSCSWRRGADPWGVLADQNPGAAPSAVSAAR